MYAPKLQANVLGFMLSQKNPKQTKNLNQMNSKN